MELIPELWAEHYFNNLAPNGLDSFVCTTKEIDEHWVAWLDACLKYHLDKKGNE